MKKYIPYLVIFIIGALAGMWAHRQYHFRDTTNMPQNDTIVRLDTVKYSKLELIGKNYRLDIPKVNMSELVYIHSDYTTIIYRDSIRYVTLPRQYFFTRTADAEIYHSGIDSRIDSLNVFHKTQTITQTVTQTATHSNALTFGIEPSYLNTFSIPIYLEYERMLHKNIGIYGQLQYDLRTNLFGVGIGAKVSIGW
jgi:hypothetical protein